MTRAHACGVAGLVAGAANAAGLRVVYGQDVSAAGAPGRDDRPTMLCLLGFGAAQLPAEVFDPLRELAGSRAAIHTASARLFVFAASDVGSLEREAPLLALAHDYGAVRAVGAAKEVGERVFASEAAADAVRVNGDLIPARNLRVLGLDR
jgi:hypothetical protein